MARDPRCSRGLESDSESRRCRHGAAANCSQRVQAAHEREVRATAALRQAIVAQGGQREVVTRGDRQCRACVLLPAQARVQPARPRGLGRMRASRCSAACDAGDELFARGGERAPPRPRSRTTSACAEAALLVAQHAPRRAIRDARWRPPLRSEPVAADRPQQRGRRRASESLGRISRQLQPCQGRRRSALCMLICIFG